LKPRSAGQRGGGFVSEEESVKSSPSGRGRVKVAAVGLAAVIAAAGLLLAVGAGARSGPSVRDASYPVTYTYKMSVGYHVGKAKAGSRVNFRFHPVYASNGQKPPHSATKYLRYKCKLDKKHTHGCSSPTDYSGVSKGRHKFSVQAFYKHTTSAASAKKRVKFKVS
jgi:hypothetical protein